MTQSQNKEGRDRWPLKDRGFHCACTFDRPEDFGLTHLVEPCGFHAAQERRIAELEHSLSEGALVRDALDHIMRVAREGVQPTRRLDWIVKRAERALEGKEPDSDDRPPENSVLKMHKEFAECREKLHASEAYAGLCSRLLERALNESITGTLAADIHAALAKNPNDTELGCPTRQGDAGSSPAGEAGSESPAVSPTQTEIGKS